MNKQAVVLFGHGARDPLWAGPMQRLAEKIRTLQPDVWVETAFLEFMSPSLAEAADAAVAEGATALNVVPVFLAQGGHVRRDLPEMLAAIQLKHPTLLIHLEGVLGEKEAVLDAMANATLAALT